MALVKAFCVCGGLCVVGTWSHDLSMAKTYGYISKKEVRQARKMNSQISFCLCFMFLQSANLIQLDVMKREKKNNLWTQFNKLCF